jgi:hypothetical protein
VALSILCRDLCQTVDFQACGRWPGSDLANFVRRQGPPARKIWDRKKQKGKSRQNWENLKAMLAIYFAFYNFCRIHSSIRCTPAMEAGITQHVWSLTDLLTA